MRTNDARSNRVFYLRANLGTPEFRGLALEYRECLIRNIFHLSFLVFAALAYDNIIEYYLSIFSESIRKK